MAVKLEWGLQLCKIADGEYRPVRYQLDSNFP